MIDDIFSISDLKDIISAFPLNGTGRGLIPTASGDGFVLETTVRQGLLELCETGNKRRSLGEISNTFDVDRNVFHRLLNAEDSACYSLDMNSLISATEVRRILNNLSSQAQVSFVRLVNFCSDEDVSLESLLRQVKLYNTESEHPLSAVRWLDEDERGADVYICTSPQLSRAKEEVAALINEAVKDARRAVWTEEKMYGLDRRSFMNFSRKVANDQMGDSIDWTVNDHINGNISFTPLAYITIMKLEKVKVVRGLIKDLGEGNRRFISLSELGRSGSDPSCDMAGTNSSSVGSSTEMQSSAALFSEELGDSDAAVLLDDFVLSKSFVQKTIPSLKSKIELFAQRLWATYASSPSTVPYPVAPSISAFRADMRLQNGPDIPVELLQQLFDAEISKEAKTIFDSHIAQLDLEDEQLFTSVWRKEVMLRVLVYYSALQKLEEGKLRMELTSLFVDYLTRDLLPEGSTEAGRKASRNSKSEARNFLSIDPETGKTGVTFHGKRLVPAVDRLNAQCVLFQQSDVASAALRNAKTIMDTFATKLGISGASDEEVTAKQDELVREALRKLETTKINKDKDGSALFLGVVLVLLAKHDKGLLYASGRFVPRLLKLLKSYIDEEQYERLQALKEEVKKGSLSVEQREELIAMVAEP